MGERDSHEISNALCFIDFRGHLRRNFCVGHPDRNSGRAGKYWDFAGICDRLCGGLGHPPNGPSTATTFQDAMGTVRPDYGDGDFFTDDGRASWRYLAAAHHLAHPGDGALLWLWPLPQSCAVNGRQQGPRDGGLNVMGCAELKSLSRKWKAFFYYRYVPDAIQRIGWLAGHRQKFF